MFAWLKQFLPKRPPEGSHDVLVKEIHATVKFFGVDAAAFGVAMVNREVNVVPLLHEVDGPLRRKAIVGMLLKGKWIPEHRYNYLMSQEVMVAKLEHWYTTGEFPS